MTDDEGPESGAEADPAAGEPEGDDVEVSGTNGVAESEAAAEADGESIEEDADATGDEAAANAEVVEEAREVEAGPPIGEDITDRIAEHDESLASEVALIVEKALELKKRVDEQAEELEAKDERIDQLESALKKSKADFQNYKKRQDREKERIRDRATEDLVERLLDVRDNLTRAAEEDHDDVASIQEGVKMTLKEFDRVLEAENVTEIRPDPGDDVDPQRHEVMMRVESDQPADTIADVYSSGYEMADKVLKTAQITVSEGPADDDEAVEDADAEANEDADAEADEEVSDEAEAEANEEAGKSEDAESPEPAPAAGEAEPVEPTDDDVIAAEPVEEDGSEGDADDDGDSEHAESADDADEAGQADEDEADGGEQADEGDDSAPDDDSVADSEDGATADSDSEAEEATTSEGDDAEEDVDED